MNRANDINVRRGYRNGVRERTLTGPTGPVVLTLPRATLFKEEARAQELELVSLGELIHQHVRAAIETAVHEELRAALGTSRYERRTAASATRKNGRRASSRAISGACRRSM